MTADHQELRELLGAYLLQQLDVDDRRAVEWHLATCPDCRAEAAELEPVVAALNRIDPAALGQSDPPAYLEESVLDRVRDRRAAATRRTRLRRAAAALAVAASVAVAFGIGSWYSGPRLDPPVVAIALQVDAPGLTADGGLVKHTWGTELKLEATGLADGQSYAVTFLRDDGARVSAGSFLGTGARPVRCSVNAALPIDSATRVEVTDARGVLVLDADLG